MANDTNTNEGDVFSIGVMVGELRAKLKAIEDERAREAAATSSAFADYDDRIAALQAQIDDAKASGSKPDKDTGKSADKPATDTKSSEPDNAADDRRSYAPRATTPVRARRFI